MTTPTPPQDPFVKPQQQPGYPPPPATPSSAGGPPFPPPQQGYQQPYPQQPYQQYPQAPYGAPGYPPPHAGYAPAGGPGSPAGMGNRLLARIIDAIIVGIPIGVILGVAIASVASKATCITDSTGTNCTVNGGIGAGVLLAYVVCLVLGILYEVFFIGTKGATPGKRIMGIKVVDSQTGNPVGMGRAFVRYLVLSITGAICTLGYWSPFFDNSGRKQGWHDKAANDLVVSSR